MNNTVLAPRTVGLEVDSDICICIAIYYFIQKKFLVKYRSKTLLRRLQYSFFFQAIKIQAKMAGGEASTSYGKYKNLLREEEKIKNIFCLMNRAE